MTCADDEVTGADEALDGATAAAAAAAKPLRWGKEGAGGPSNSPVFKAAIREGFGITRHQIVLPPYVQQTIADVKTAVDAAGDKADKKLVWPAYHMLANFALNDFGTQAAKAVKGIFQELGGRLEGEVPTRLLVGGEAVNYANGIQIRFGELKRGGSGARSIAIRFPEDQVKSPMRTLMNEGKLTLLPLSTAAAPRAADDRNPPFLGGLDEDGSEEEEGAEAAQAADPAGAGQGGSGNHRRDRTPDAAAAAAAAAARRRGTASAPTAAPTAAPTDAPFSEPPVYADESTVADEPINPRAKQPAPKPKAPRSNASGNKRGTTAPRAKQPAPKPKAPRTTAPAAPATATATAKAAAPSDKQAANELLQEDLREKPAFDDIICTKKEKMDLAVSTSVWNEPVRYPATVALRAQVQQKKVESGIQWVKLYGQWFNLVQDDRIYGCKPDDSDEEEEEGEGEEEDEEEDEDDDDDDDDDDDEPDDDSEGEDGDDDAPRT